MNLSIGLDGILMALLGWDSLLITFLFVEEVNRRSTCFTCRSICLISIVIRSFSI